MKVLYFSIFASRRVNETIARKTGNVIATSTDKYSRLINEGLYHHLGAELKTYCVPLLAAWPGSNVVCFRGLPQYEDKNGKLHYIGFINIHFLKQFCILIHVFWSALVWGVRNRKEKDKIAVIGIVYWPFLAGIRLAKIFCRIKIVLFVPDLPDFGFTYSKQQSLFVRYTSRFYILLSNAFLKLADYFVFITKYTPEYMGTDKPYTVMEGLVDATDRIKGTTENERNKAIMYAGALYEKYGILNMVKAFMQLKTDYELWLFGSGDIEMEIRHYAALDERIKFFGTVSPEDVINYELQVSLLINPRPSEGEYTKHSFPSKLMEYMLTATPVLTTLLPGIPDEYADKMFYIKDESVEGIEKAMEMCLNSCSTDPVAYFNKGKAAREYVLKEKNNYILMGRLLQNLSYENNCH